MRVLFLQSLTYPFIGVMSLSAVLRKRGHETRLFILNLGKATSRDFSRIRDFAPDLVAIPVYTGWQSSILEFCRQLKERMGVKTVLGGPHPTHCPDIIRRDVVDYICVGEGEISFLELAERLSHGLPTHDIPGIWLRNGCKVLDNGPSLLPPLDQLPPMDIDLYCTESKAIRVQDHREFSLNRGCPFQCTYCTEPSLKSLYGPKVVRSKSVDQALEELHYVNERHPFKSAAFTSDNLFVKREFAFEFLNRYKREIGKPFYCQMRVEFVDHEISQALRDAGCHMVAVGIESGSPRVRSEILNRHMSNDTITRACRMLRDHGIQVNAYNMVGLPGETFKEALETIELNSEIAASSSWCSFFQPYPGSKLTAQLREQGVVSDATLEEIPASFFDRTILFKEDSYRWMNLQRLFQLWVRYPSLGPLFLKLCRLRIPRVYDPVFLYSFYQYVRKAYKMGRAQALARVVTNALQALRA